jgi:hypothetical protein
MSVIYVSFCKMLLQNLRLKENQKKIRGMNIGIQSNDGILSSYERGNELPYYSWDNFRLTMTMLDAETAEAEEKQLMADRETHR